MADNSLIPVALGRTETFANKDISGVRYPKHILYDSTGTEIPLATSTKQDAIISALQGVQASRTDRSGTITTGGAAQEVAAINANRKGFCLQNISSGDMWLSDVGTAAPNQPSFFLPPGAYLEFSGNGIPTTAISLYGATTGQGFSAREW